MENVTIQEVALALINLAVLALQYVVFRFIKGNKITSNLNNQEVIASIARDLNNVTRSISLTMQSAGLYDKTPGEGPEDPPEDDQARRMAQKSALWRGYRRKGDRA